MEGQLQRPLGGGGWWSESVREETPTEHTDSDTHTQRERNTHRTHPRESVRGCERALAKGNAKQVKVKGQRPDAKGHCQRTVAAVRAR